MKTERNTLAALTWLIALSAGFASVNIMSNVSSVRIVEYAGISVDAGTLLFPLTFTLRDLVHKVGGKKLSRRVVIIAATLSGVASLNFWIVGKLPPDLSVGLQTEFGDLLSITWRIAVAGVVAQLVSELVDTEVYAFWEKKFGERLQVGRVLVSNAVSVPIDSFVFVLVAFAGVYDSKTLLAIALGNIVLKYAITAVFSPMIKLVPRLPQVV